MKYLIWVFLFSLNAHASFYNPISGRPPHPRPAATLDSDSLARAIANSPQLRTVGAVTEAERLILRDPKHPSYLATRNSVVSQFLNAYDSDLLSSRGSSVRVELMEGLSKQGYNTTELSQVRAEIRPQTSGHQLVKNFRQGLLKGSSARIHCTVEGCDQDSPEFKAIRMDEQILTTPDKPFGQIQSNSEFLVKVAKALAQFRLGIEDNPLGVKRFQAICGLLGGEIPAQEKSNGEISTPSQKRNSADQGQQTR